MFKKILQYILQKNNFNEVKQFNRSDINDIRKMIESFSESLNHLAKQKIMNSRQENLSSLFANISKLMMEIKIKDKKEANIFFSISELIMKKPEILLILLAENNRIEFEFETQGQMLMESVINLEVRLL